ncbi:nucleoside recognition protein [Gottschalkiaceae bacterium SANA]|nr:nucleoside recognition protein [Gottschalkiaceae bacterium SANA]
MVNSIKTGFWMGVRTTGMLARVIAPVYFVVAVLSRSGGLELIAHWFEPIMRMFGLPGEAALVLVLGNAVNLYAALGAIAVISLTRGQLTVLALMLGFSHSLFVESAVVKQTGVSIRIILPLRLGMMVLVGLLAGQLLGGVA